MTEQQPLFDFEPTGSSEQPQERQELTPDALRELASAIGRAARPSEEHRVSGAYAELGGGSSNGTAALDPHVYSGGRRPHDVALPDNPKHGETDGWRGLPGAQHKINREGADKVRQALGDAQAS